MRGNRWVAVAVLVASTVAWPAIQLAVFVLRFDKLPPGGWTEAFVFVPMGFASGAVAALLWTVAKSPRARRAVLIGYLAASPLAFLGGLLGGLFLPGFWGPLLLGGLPLVAGCIVGLLVAR